MPSMGKQKRFTEYLTMVAKLWGDQISGPILAVIAIIAVCVEAKFANDPTATATVARYTAWVTGGMSALLILVAQYKAWSAERDKYEVVSRKLEEIERSKPHIKLREPNAIHVRQTGFQSRDGFHLFNAPVLRVRFVNDPEHPYPNAVARDIRAKIHFYKNDSLIRRVDGRWADSDQASLRDKRQSRDDLLGTDFAIGAEHDLDIAFQSSDGTCFIWNNDSYDNAFNPELLLDGTHFRIEIRLRGTWVDTTFSFSFRTNNNGFEIEA